VVRIPHAVDIGNVSQRSREDFGIPGSSFVFLTIFDMLSVYQRKNPLAVIKAFSQALRGAGDWFLVLKVNHPETAPERMRELKNAAAPYPAKILDSTLPRPDLNALINCCDCLVSLHRSEGFGLTMAEAMALGKPVIATAYSGNVDFTKPGNSFLVDYGLRRVGPDCDPYPSTASWAEPSIEHAATQMRLVRECTDIRQARAAAGREWVREHLSPAAVGELMRTRLPEVRKAGFVRVARSHNFKPAEAGVGNREFLARSSSVV
jgi:glycosyltransferase involved in cell wall biosynthesis